ncbi:MAG: ribonuclease E/G, partial [Mucispirillum sp.]|nr:ribonuclease E/G [Mucispirillum sp.]
MSKEILINSGIREVRAAVLTGGNVSEIFIERVNKKSAAGNIYKGKVVKVLPGMQSAFVEIGLQRAAFLHIADIYTGSSDELSYEESMPEDDSEARVSEEIHSEQQHYAPIAEILTEGQEIIVQVAKDAIAAKGARLTTHLTIPGRYLVLMPGYEHIGVSRKIENEAERERLKDILTKLRPESMGLIARTVSDGLSLEELMADLEYIKGVWAGVEAVTHSSTAPSLLYEDHNLIYKILRDVVTADTTRILIDNKADYDKMQEFFVNHLSNLDLKIEYYQGDEPLFDLYNVEIEVNRLLDKKVWLRSGGSIVIDQAEALTVI